MSLAHGAMTEDELEAITGLAVRRGRVPGPTALRMADEIRRLRLDLLATVTMGLALYRELDHQQRLTPPGAPRLADFDS